MILLTRHISLEEMTRSDKATRLGIPNEPDGFQLNALKALAVHTLEPVRVACGAPMDVLSGLRVPALNAVTPGSSNTSQHTKGEAADFRIKNRTPVLITRWLAEQNAIPFDQLILEFPDHNNHWAGWTHISYTATRTNRRMVLTATRGTERTIYATGLPGWVTALPPWSP